MYCGESATKTSDAPFTLLGTYRRCGAMGGRPRARRCAFVAFVEAWAVAKRNAKNERTRMSFMASAKRKGVCW